MKSNINELFSMLDNSRRKKENPISKVSVQKAQLPGSVALEQPDLFSNCEENSSLSRYYEKEDIDFLSSYFSDCFYESVLCAEAKTLFNLSFEVFDNIIHAWMSELPIEKEIIAYGRTVIKSSQKHDNFKDKQNAANRAANDRGNEDTRVVLNAAANVYKEIHRMMGLLRFSPVKGIYIARCAPDHLIIPALAEYFSSRFADTQWVIIDEKRDFCLYRLSGCAKAVFSRCAEKAGFENIIQDDEWEKLWMHYHKTINNESRKNLKTQRQFMPERYWKYLPEKELNKKPAF